MIFVYSNGRRPISNVKRNVTISKICNDQSITTVTETAFNSNSSRGQIKGTTFQKVRNCKVWSALLQQCTACSCVLFLLVVYVNDDVAA